MIAGIILIVCSTMLVAIGMEADRTDDPWAIPILLGAIVAAGLGIAFVYAAGGGS